MEINPVVLYIILGLIAITLIAVLGAIASRRFNFSYSKLALASLLIYILSGFLIAGKATLDATVLACGLLGFFESTIRWKLCLQFNTNMSEREQQSTHTPAYARVLVMIIIAIVCGYIGYLMATN